MENVKYSEEEKKELEEIKENIELEYFLNKKAMETANVDDMEVLQVYQNNIDKLKDADITAVLPQLKDIELEYFLNKKAMETANVDDMEVLQVYQNNIDKLKDADITAVLPQLKDQMLFQRREEE